VDHVLSRLDLLARVVVADPRSMSVISPSAVLRRTVPLPTGRERRPSSRNATMRFSTERPPRESLRLLCAILFNVAGRCTTLLALTFCGLDPFGREPAKKRLRYAEHRVGRRAEFHSQGTQSVDEYRRIAKCGKVLGEAPIFMCGTVLCRPRLDKLTLSQHHESLCRRSNATGPEFEELFEVDLLTRFYRTTECNGHFFAEQVHEAEKKRLVATPIRGEQPQFSGNFADIGLIALHERLVSELTQQLRVVRKGCHEIWNRSRNLGQRHLAMIFPRPNILHVAQAFMLGAADGALFELCVVAVAGERRTLGKHASL